MLFRSRRKANHDNIDLNRSFVTRQGPGGEQALPSNPHHDDPALRALLEPPRPQPLLPQVARILLAAVRGQTAALTQALTMGQYTSPQGLYFGGTKEPVATTSLKQTFEKALTSAASVTVLDLHTGYGPRNTLAVVNSRYEPVSPGDWARRLSWPLVQSADGDSFYAIHGDMTDWLTLRQQQLAPQKPFWATTLEFGTWGDGLGAQIRTLRASVNENAAYWRGTPAQKRRWSAALADLYAPRSLRWRRAVVSQARELLPRVLSLHPRLASGLPAT